MSTTTVAPDSGLALVQRSNAREDVKRNVPTAADLLRRLATIGDEDDPAWYDPYLALVNLAEMCRTQLGLEPVPHFTAWNRDLLEALDAAHDLGSVDDWDVQARWLGDECDVPRQSDVRIEETEAQILALVDECAARLLGLGR